MMKKAIYWKASVQGGVDSIFLDISRFVEIFSEDSKYIEEIKENLGLNVKEKYDFILATNRKPVIYEGKIEGGVTVSFGEIKMEFMSDKKAVKEWLDKYEEYEITMKF